MRSIKTALITFIDGTSMEYQFDEMRLWDSGLNLHLGEHKALYVAFRAIKTIEYFENDQGQLLDIKA